MNILKILAIVFALAYNSACTPKAKQSFTTPKEANVIKIKYSDINYETDHRNLFASTQIVKLETNEHSLIGSVGKIIYENEKYYILDRNRQSVFIFDSKGKFINKLYKLGKGPEEYIELRDFDINKNGDICILTFRKILIYNSSTLNFIEERKLSPASPYAKATKLVNNQNYLFLFSGSFGLKQNDIQETKYYAINVVDQNSNILNRYFPVIFRYPIVHNTFYKSNEHIYLSNTFGNDTIYCIDESHINPVIFVDFDRKITKSEMIGNRDEAFSSVKNNNLMGGITRIYENNLYLCFAFTCGHKIKQAVYNKKSKALKIINVSNESLPFPSILVDGVADNTFFSFVSSYLIKESSEKNNSIKEFLNKNSLSDLKETDNPIIIKYKFTF
jgi:hypothetical protein